MALATTVGVEHIPLSERPQYGQPYPDGIALAQSQVADDASGGAHTWTISADPGFIYRMELFNLTRGETTSRVFHAVTVHRWIAAKSPGALAAFDLNWTLLQQASSGFGVYSLNSAIASYMPQIRRFPMGAALGGGAPGVSAQLMVITNPTNTTGITNELSVVWTYWRKEALYLPGFLSAFYEAPAVPPVVRSRQ